MCAERIEHPERIVVGIAAAEADEVHIGLAKRQLDLPRHMMGTLDEVDHRDGVTNALAAVGPEEGVVTELGAATVVTGLL